MQIQEVSTFLLLLIWSSSLCNGCEYLSRDLCPTKQTSKCDCSRVNTTTVICCDIASDFKLIEGLGCASVRLNTTRIVHIHNATFTTFNAGMEEWTNLESLFVTEGQIKRIQGKFSGNLACANFSGNNITNVDSKLFEELPNLKMVDLSRNNLTNIPNLALDKKRFTIDISNNSYMICSDIIELLFKYHNSSNVVEFNNRNTTTCLSATSFHWFNTTDVMTLSQMEQYTKWEEKCPRGNNFKCICKLYRMDFMAKNTLPVIKISVNCSNQQLTALPDIPPVTTVLDVTNNYIESLAPLSTNPNYSDVRILLADNNRIESISVLEGTRFIDNFAILSLRNNKIKSIPTYILSNAFDRNFGQRIAKFGGNRLTCDCSTAQIKIWLLSNKNYIEDYDEILCDRGFEKVIDIDPSKICILEKDWTDYVYYIIAGEVLLLLMLVSKVTYDYWVFKSSGYLPWPASRMPKLPCDWCFET